MIIDLGGNPGRAHDSYVDVGQGRNRCLGLGRWRFCLTPCGRGGQLQVIGITGKKCSDNSSSSMRLRSRVPASFPTTWGAAQSCAEPPEARWSRSSCFSGHAPSRQPNSANVLQDVCVTSGTNRTWLTRRTTGSSSELQSESNGTSPARDSPYQRSSIVPIVRQSGHAMVGKDFTHTIPRRSAGVTDRDSDFPPPCVSGIYARRSGVHRALGSTPEIKGKQRRGS